MTFFSSSIEQIYTPSSACASDYVELLKPRVMILVVFTGSIGMLLAPGECHLFLRLVALLCLAAGAGASAVFNMVWERDLDALMSRTRGRPIPSGRVSPESALVFGSVLAAFSVLTMGLAINFWAAFWLVFTIFFYSVIYTLGLKRYTPQNIVLGGAAGALPPVIGWVSVTGSVAHPLPWILFGIIFLWTPPHFWALALGRKEDYVAAHIPMMPLVVGVRRTLQQMRLYTVLLVALSLTPGILGVCGWVYELSALGLGLYFTRSVWRLRPESENVPAAMRVFGDSIAYLFFLFLSLALDWFVKI